MGEIDGDGVGRHEYVPLAGDVGTWCGHIGRGGLSCAKSKDADIHSVVFDGTTTEITLPAVQALDLDPLEFWRDLAEALGHQRPAKADIPALVSEVAAREQLIESLVEAANNALEWFAAFPHKEIYSKLDVVLTAYATWKKGQQQ